MAHCGLALRQRDAPHGMPHAQDNIIDTDNRSILIREAKGIKDRRVILPTRLSTHVVNHLRWLRTVLMSYLDVGFGRVFLPNALDRIYPNPATAWG
jgi:hypothetical protein